MFFFSHFPFLEGLVDPQQAELLERRFKEACERAGVDPDSPEAEAIGIGLVADLAGGWPAVDVKPGTQ